MIGQVARAAYWKNRKRVHEWGVVAQTHPGHREFWRCDHCGKFCECGDTSKLWTLEEFDKMAKELGNMYQVDSDIPWGAEDTP